MLCNDKGGTIAISDLLFGQSFKPKYKLIFIKCHTNKITPYNTFMLPINQIEKKTYLKFCRCLHASVCAFHAFAKDIFVEEETVLH